ncbi:ferredoxin reductase [Dietzia sp. 179-F 9C3 NHS]|uniref:ferredoxin reductase n=1 Tax=Dietzia sp. 179-F 9C3 NHS TaxID=3374295 RepID=UPI0038797B79
MSESQSGLSRVLRAAAARVPEPRTAHRLLRRLTHPLLPDDYSSLVYPLWSSRELRGEVVSVRRETEDVVTLVIKPGWGASPRYQPGQYLGIGVLLEGRWTWRSYSLTSAPSSGRGEYSVTVKAMPEGLLSNHIVGTVEPGTIVRLAAPAGDFHLPSPTPPKIMFVTAGSGITPVMGMLRSLDRRAVNDEFPDVVHVHSVRERKDTLFHEELLALEKTQPGYTMHLRVTSEEGRIDAPQMSALVPDWAERPTWACGPNAMLDELAEHFDATGRDDLYVERFTVNRDAGASGGTVTFGSTGKTVELDGATTILEGGEKVGVQMPFGCRMGICQTCVVGLEDGHVRDLRNGTDHGPGERIQTCVSVACGDVEIKI